MSPTGIAAWLLAALFIVLVTGPHTLKWGKKLDEPVDYDPFFEELNRRHEAKKALWRKLSEHSQTPKEPYEDR